MVALQVLKHTNISFQVNCFYYCKSSLNFSCRPTNSFNGTQSFLKTSLITPPFFPHPCYIQCILQGSALLICCNMLFSIRSVGCFASSPAPKQEDYPLSTMLLFIQYMHSYSGRLEATWLPLIILPKSRAEEILWDFVASAVIILCNLG